MQKHIKIMSCKYLHIAHSNALYHMEENHDCAEPCRKLFDEIQQPFMILKL